jgi:hypothetical protein
LAEEDAVADDPRRTPDEERAGIPGSAYVGLAIVLIGVAMVLQAYLFDGDKLSPAGRALMGIW